jgi:hypothetical protein
VPDEEKILKALKRDRIAALWLPTQQANKSRQAARFDRSSANAALPVRVASDIVSKNSDCRTGLLFPAV